MFLLKPKEVVEKRLADNVGSYDQTDAVRLHTMVSGCGGGVEEAHRFTVVVVGDFARAHCPLLPSAFIFRHRTQSPRTVSPVPCPLQVCTRTLGYLESQLKDASSNLEELLKTVKSA